MQHSPIGYRETKFRGTTLHDADKIISDFNDQPRTKLKY